MQVLIVDSKWNPALKAIGRLLERLFRGVVTKTVESQDAADEAIRDGFAPSVILVAGRSSEYDGRTGPMVIGHLREIYTGSVIEILAAGSLDVHADALDELDKVRLVHRLIVTDVDGIKAIIAGVLEAEKR